MVLCENCGTLNKNFSRECAYCDTRFTKEQNNLATLTAWKKCLVWFKMPKNQLLAAKGLMYGMALFFVAYMFGQKDAILGKGLYAKAQELYKTENYTESLAFYDRFIAACPDDDLIPSAQKTVSKIRYRLLATAKEQKENLKEVPDLLAKAKTAIANKRFLLPVQDNAMNYIWKVRSIDPDNFEAAHIQGKLIRYLRKQANHYRNNGNIRLAVKLYKKILQITPKNPEVNREFNELVAMAGDGK